MKNCFNFETKYRSTEEPNLIKFVTSDGTCWTLFEEWICEEEGNIEQTLLFRKENYNYRSYLINIEITSVSKGVSGKATMAQLAEFRMTEFTIPISTFDVFKYSSHDLLKVRSCIISQNVLKDAFRYKVTFTRTDLFDNNSYGIPTQNDLLTYSDQMLCLLFDGKFSDIVLASADSANIPAHRSILAARSYYFFRIFKEDINPDTAAVFDAKFNLNVLCDMLCFMYSGQVRPMEFSDAFSLYTMANTYLIPSLENITHNLILSEITVANVSDLLLKANTLRLLRLKDSCIKFIAKYFDEIRGVCPYWQKIEIYHSDLFNDVLRQVYKV